MNNQKAAIILGGTGFIGSALADELVRRGERVISISRSIPEEQKSGIEYYVCDISTQSDELTEILGTGNTIFLLTGQNYAGFDVEKEKNIFSRILDIVKTVSPEKVLFTSSALIYGDCDVPASEDHQIEPKEIYSAFKVECEKIIRDRLAGIPVGILRLANVYGSEKNKGFIGLAFQRALDGSLLRIDGDGSQLRDYIFLDDVIFAILAVRDGLVQTDVVNISTGKSVSLLDIIRIVSEITQKDIDFEITGIPVLDTKKSFVDNTKLLNMYHFSPSQSLPDGLSKTWERYVDSLKH